jgi:hypothetical protein
MTAPDPGDDGGFPSGPWTGYYQDCGSRFRQDLQLTFRNGTMTGTGSDCIGRFTVRGRYDRDSRDVRWTKQYVGAHPVHYRGFREIRGIWGVWEIGARRSGFHIWPVGEGEAAAAETEAEVEAPARAR